MQSALATLARRAAAARPAAASLHTGVEIVGSVAPTYQPWFDQAFELGKHDPRTRRGKVYKGSFGKARPKSKPLHPWDPKTWEDPTALRIPPPPPPPSAPGATRPASQ